MPFCLSPRPAASDLECWQLPPASAQVPVGTAVPSPHFPLPPTPVLADEQSEPVQEAQLVDNWHSIHPSYFLLSLLHPRKAQMPQLLQGRIGSQQGRLRAIWIVMEVQSVF